MEAFVNDLIVWSGTRQGADGTPYSVRYLLTLAELEDLQRVGLLGEVDEVIGLATVADAVVAQLEINVLKLAGVALQ